MGSYEAQVETVRDCYNDRVLAVLARIRDAVREAGLQCDNPEPTHGDRFEWSLRVGEKGPDAIAVNLVICEQRDHEGAGTGITFRLAATQIDGRVLAEFSPANFTPAVWIDVTDSDALEDRFALLETFDPDEMVTSLASGVEA